MTLLRWLFVAAFCGCFLFVAANARWEGRLNRAGHTWIIDLGRTPVWAPPLDPTYEAFRHDFSGSEGFPGELARGMTIQRLMKADWMAVDLLLHLWGVTIATGLLYLGLRGHRRDLILHVAMTAGFGLTAAGACCVSIWVLFGGWGPPAPEKFGFVGLLLGVVCGFTSFTPRAADQRPATETVGV